MPFSPIRKSVSVMIAVGFVTIGYSFGCEVGGFKPFMWLVKLRSVRTETVSINANLQRGIALSMESASWGIIEKRQENATTLAVQGIISPMATFVQLRCAQGFTFEN